jgi:hypothetical protein
LLFNSTCLVADSPLIFAKSISFCATTSKASAPGSSIVSILSFSILTLSSAFATLWSNKSFSILKAFFAAFNLSSSDFVTSSAISFSSSIFALCCAVSTFNFLCESMIFCCAF